MGRNVHENVRSLRDFLGSVSRALSAGELAKMITDVHPNRRISLSQVQRWESAVEPDYESLRIMAGWSPLSIEQFAYGDPSAPPPHWVDEDEGPLLPGGAKFEPPRKAERPSARRKQDGDVG